MAATKKVRLTRSVRLNGQHGKKGSIQELPLELANELMAGGSAEPLGVIARIADRMREAVHGDPRDSRNDLRRE